MPDAPPKKDKLPEVTPQNVAIVETAAHAAEVRACQAGQNMLESTYRSLGHAACPLQPPPHLTKNLAPGHAWESWRPLELDSPAAPVIRFQPSWDRRRGRFSQWRGLKLLLVRSRPTH